MTKNRKRRADPEGSRVSAVNAKKVLDTAINALSDHTAGTGSSCSFCSSPLGNRFSEVVFASPQVTYTFVVPEGEFPSSYDTSAPWPICSACAAPFRANCIAQLADEAVGRMRRNGGTAPQAGRGDMQAELIGWFARFRDNTVDVRPAGGNA